MGSGFGETPNVGSARSRGRYRKPCLPACGWKLRIAGFLQLEVAVRIVGAEAAAPAGQRNCLVLDVRRCSEERIDLLSLQ